MKTAIVIGRFQVPELTHGQKKFLAEVHADFERVGFFLGVPVALDAFNPLTYMLRLPLLEAYDPYFVRPLKDIPGNNPAWSRALDTAVHMLDNTYNLGDITLVGGRRSFANSYSGVYKVRVYNAYEGESGTEVRAQIAARPKNSPQFREGVIWAMCRGRSADA